MKLRVFGHRLVDYGVAILGFLLYAMPLILILLAPFMGPQ